MPLYRRRARPVEAFRWSNNASPPSWFVASNLRGLSPNEGDWICRENDQIFNCSTAVFETNFEPIVSERTVETTPPLMTYDQQMQAKILLTQAENIINRLRGQVAEMAPRIELLALIEHLTLGPKRSLSSPDPVTQIHTFLDLLNQQQRNRERIHSQAANAQSRL